MSESNGVKPTLLTMIEAFELVMGKIRILQVHKKEPLRIAINGIEGTGKTFFAIAFEQYLHALNYKAFHISIDGFHKQKEYRYKQGKDSAKGYYEDSYDEQSFVKKVLKQSQKFPYSFIPAIHDLQTDELLNSEPIYIGEKSILLTDGAYLFKDIYMQYWDIKIYLKTDFNTAMERGIKRDAEYLGGTSQARDKYLSRYHAASRMYITDCNPEEKADIIFNNTDFKTIVLEKG